MSKEEQGEGLTDMGQRWKGREVNEAYQENRMGFSISYIFPLTLSLSPFSQPSNLPPEPSDPQPNENLVKPYLTPPYVHHHDGVITKHKSQLQT